MAKLKPVRIPSDDCVVTARDGSKSTPHEGEWIEIRAVLPVAEYGVLAGYYVRAAGRREAVAERWAAADGGTRPYAEVYAEDDEQFTDLCAVLSRFIVNWNWTDDLGEELSPPRGSAKAIQQLTSEEIYYLLKAVMQGGSQAAAGEGSAPPPAGS